jgi:hypothetical protein
VISSFENKYCNIPTKSIYDERSLHLELNFVEYTANSSEEGIYLPKPGLEIDDFGFLEKFAFKQRKVKARAEHLLFPSQKFHSSSYTNCNQLRSRCFI